MKLLPIRVFDPSAASDVQFALGIDAAWQNEAQVINNSWFCGSPSNAIISAINRATTQGRGGRGSVVVQCAGNTSNRQVNSIGAVAFPATLSNVIAVGAINRDGALTNYTAEGAALDIVAPSGHFTGRCTGEVVTTDLIGAAGCNDGPQGNIDYSSTFSGCSAAVPEVVAAAAMVISRSPTMTEAQVRSALTSNADPWGPATQFGSGKLNAYRALVGRTRVGISGPSFPATAGSYTYTANASGGVGGYHYQWSASYNGGPVQGVGSNSPTLSLFVGEDDDIDLEVVVTNGPDNQRAGAFRSIAGPTSCSVRSADGSIIIPTC